jgi:hypothetical protein
MWRGFRIRLGDVMNDFDFRELFRRDDELRREAEAERALVRSPPRVSRIGSMTKMRQRPS